MTFVVTDNCIACKYTDCVDACPVDCFHEGENMLVINPDECIDCGVCEPECPASAIKAGDSDDVQEWVQFNASYASKWPVIYATIEPLEDADANDGLQNKLQTHFQDAPAEHAA